MDVFEVPRAGRSVAEDPALSRTSPAQNLHEPIPEDRQHGGIYSLSPGAESKSRLISKGALYGRRESDLTHHPCSDVVQTARAQQGPPTRSIARSTTPQMCDDCRATSAFHAWHDLDLTPSFNSFAWTYTKGPRQPDHQRSRATQNTRSKVLRTGRFRFRWKAASCSRSAAACSLIRP